MRPPLCRRVGDDLGETLVELLVTVIIMTIAVVAIVGGIAVSIRMSDIHRKQATAGADVRSYAEAIQNYIAADKDRYKSCAPDGTYDPTTVGFTASPGFTASVVPGSLKSWNADTKTWIPCTVDTDKGVQQVTLQVASGDSGYRRVTEQIVIVIRDPCRPLDTLCA
jgi:Tfp pilus assembly protein PilV